MELEDKSLLTVSPQVGGWRSRMPTWEEENFAIVLTIKSLSNEAVTDEASKIFQERRNLASSISHLNDTKHFQRNIP